MQFGAFYSLVVIAHLHIYGERYVDLLIGHIDPQIFLLMDCFCFNVQMSKQEDPWNAIMSGAATGGILAARAGMKAAGKSALAGGVILAAIEGLNIVVVSGAVT